MAFDDISGLVLTLYRASGELSVNEFQEKALEIVSLADLKYHALR